MENEEASEEFDSGSTEALVEEYEMKRRNRADDIIATQAVICILLALLFIAGSIFLPELTGEVFGRLKSLAADSSEVIANPIDIILGYIDKL